MTRISLPAKPWALNQQETRNALDVQHESGLDDQAVLARREQFGHNRLRQTERRNAWEIFLEQFKSLVVLLLIVAAIVAFAFGEVVDSVAILAVVLINALIGFITEWRAVRLEALQNIGDVRTKVRRNDSVHKINAEALVPGDIVMLEGGDVITTDICLLEAANLQVNESALTGGSVPVAKQVDPVAAETPLAERLFTSLFYLGF